MCMYVHIYMLWFNFLLPIVCLNKNWYLLTSPFLFFSMSFYCTLLFLRVQFLSFQLYRHNIPMNIFVVLHCFSCFLIFWFAVWQLSPLPCWISWRHSTPKVNYLSVYDETEHFLLTPSMYHLLSYSLRLCLMNLWLALNTPKDFQRWCCRKP